jgi:hypothetical protein
MAPAQNPAPASPFEWGRQERLRELLSGNVDLKIEKATTVLCMLSDETVWKMLSEGDGPT